MKYLVSPQLDRDISYLLLSIGLSSRFGSVRDLVSEYLHKSYFFLELEENPPSQCPWIPSRDGNYILLCRDQEPQHADEWIEYLEKNIFRPLGYEIVPRGP